MAYLSWFKFTPSDWIMGKIQRTSEVTQARFMRLICLYWNKHCILSYEDAEIEIDKDHLDILISKKIIKVEDDFIVIEFLNEQLFTISETSEKRKQAVLQRWAKVKQNDTSVSNIDTLVLQNDTDKIRGYKIREDKTIKEDFDFQKLKSTEWADEFCKKKGIQSKEKFNDIFDKFIDNIKLKGEHLDYKDPEKEVKRHFVNWYDRQPIQPTTISTYKRNQVIR
jgi:hypothetical protein